MAKILIIDDDDLVRETLADIVDDIGHDVVTATDGNSGIEKLGHESFDVVITDLIMPGMDGIDVLCQIKRCHTPTRVIVMSGGSSMTALTYLDKAKSLGADGILAKPFTSSDLKNSIDATLLE